MGAPSRTGLATRKASGIPRTLFRRRRNFVQVGLCGVGALHRKQCYGVWRELFQIVLSGTATPFSQRMDLLQKRLFDTEPRIRELALQALNACLRSFSGATRSVGSKTQGGRLLPDEWRPKPNEGHQTGCITIR